MIEENKKSPTSSRPFALRAIVNGFRANILVSIVVAAYGIVMGTIAAGKGITIAELSLMSTLVLAGAAQLAVVDMWQTPVPILPIILTTLVINLRYLLIGASLNPVFRGCSLREKLLGIHLVADENWAITMQAYQRGYGTPGFLLGGGLAILVFWLAGGTTGLLFGTQLPPMKVLGLDFAITAVFISLLLNSWGGARRDLIPWAVTIIVAISTSYLLPGKWYILLGAVAGSSTAVFWEEHSNVDS
jgi:4-azaleucine resistance transporter AzlC